ncbi:MAG TPA: hypothetical protein VMH49_04840 [Thermoplasmata archaeon]|nr:hypothetical protein [Thermoplasmata archaeon]
MAAAGEAAGEAVAAVGGERTMLLVVPEEGATSVLAGTALRTTRSTAKTTIPHSVRW